MSCRAAIVFNLPDAFVVVQVHIPFFGESLEDAGSSSFTNVASDDRFDSVCGVGSAAGFLLDDREKMPARSLEANHSIDIWKY